MASLDKMSAAARSIICRHLNAIEASLRASAMTPSERRSILEDVENQIYEMLEGRTAGTPQENDVRAVLAELDAPESYLFAPDPVAPSVTPSETSTSPFHLSKTTVGWLCILCAVINIPITVLFSVIGAHGGFLEAAINPLLSIVCLGLFLCIYLNFKAVLIEQFRFVQVRGILNAVIFWALLSNGITIFDDLFVSVTLPAAFYLALAFPTGIVMTVFGIKLLPLRERLPAMKLYAGLAIAEGLCYCSVVLVLFALPLMVARDIVLGVMFLKLAQSEPGDAVPFASERAGNF